MVNDTLPASMPEDLPNGHKPALGSVARFGQQDLNAVP